MGMSLISMSFCFLSLVDISTTQRSRNMQSKYFFHLIQLQKVGMSRIGAVVTFVECDGDLHLIHGLFGLHAKKERR